MTTYTYLVMAYLGLWLLLSGYLWYLNRQLRTLTRRLQELDQR